MPIALFAQDAPSANLFEVYNMTVKAGEENAFEAATKSLKDVLHPARASFSTQLFYNIKGGYRWDLYRAQGIT